MPNQNEGNYNQEDIVRLQKGLTELYSTDELEDLCFRLGLKFDEIPGNTLSGKARELVQFLERRGRLSELVEHVAKDRPHYAWPTFEARNQSPDAARVVVEVGDALEFDCDVLVLKYAQEYWGVDLAVVSVLSPGVRDKFNPNVGEHILASSDGKVAARKVLFVGTPPIGQFDYAQIREFTKLALSILAREMPSARHVAMTIHGVGFGLDETECFLAQVAGILDSVSSNQFPRFLNKISIVERSEARAGRLRYHLEKYLPGGLLASKTDRETVATESRLRDVGQQSKHKQHIFVAMPFSEEFEDTYVFGISTPVNASGYLCERVDTQSFTGDILTRIKTRIETADLVIAELTGANPNVYLEVGYAWGKNRPTLLLVQKDATQLKFDVQGQKCIIYKNISDLKKQLEGFLGDLED